MFVYYLNKNSTPLIPLRPGKARMLLDDKKAQVYNKTPFTIRSLRQIEEYNNEKIIFNINLMFDGIEFNVISNTGNLYYYSLLKFERDMIDKVEGVFYFIQRYIPITHIYFLINSDAVILYDKKRDKTYRFIDFSYDMMRTGKFKCFICEDTTLNKEYKIVKIIKNFNFNGNSIILCNGCLKKNMEYKNKYITQVKNIFNLLLDIEKKYTKIFKDN